MRTDVGDGRAPNRAAEFARQGSPVKADRLRAVVNNRQYACAPLRRHPATQTGGTMATRRTTMRSRTGTKLYAVRDESGQFKDIQTYKRAHAADLRQKSAAETVAAQGPIEKKVRKAATDAVRSVKSSAQGMLSLRFRGRRNGPSSRSRTRSRRGRRQRRRPGKRPAHQRRKRPCRRPQRRKPRSRRRKRRHGRQRRRNSIVRVTTCGACLRACRRRFRIFFGSRRNGVAKNGPAQASGIPSLAAYAAPKVISGRTTRGTRTG